MPNTAHVDQDLCISSGKCVADFPSAFRFNEDEIAETTPLAPKLEDEEMIAAARNCPSSAIRVLDADGSEVDIW